MAEPQTPGPAQSSSGTEDAGSEVISDKDRELASLRLEVAQLRAEKAGGGTSSRRRRSISWRMISRWTLVVVGGLLAIVSVLTIWVRDQLLDTDTWVATMSSVAKSPAVQSAIANDVTNQIFERADVQTKVADNLPPNAAFLAAPLTGQLRSFTTDAAKRLVASDQFQNLWNDINRRAHGAVVVVLTGGQKGKISTSGGKVTLDLSSVTSQVQNRLQSSGISALQGVSLGNGQITLVSSPSLEKIQGAVRVMKGLAFLFPVLALGCLAGATMLSADRRRGLLTSAVGLSVAMVVLLALLALLRNIYLGEVVSPRLPADAAGDIYNAIIHFLRQSAMVVFAVGVIVAAGAALAGPSRAAVAVRRTVRGGLDSLKEGAEGRGWDFGPAAAWVGQHRGGLRIGVLLGAFIVLILWSQPTAWVVLGLALVVAVLVAAIELIGRAPPPAATETVETPAAQPPVDGRSPMPDADGPPSAPVSARRQSS